MKNLRPIVLCLIILCFYSVSVILGDYVGGPYQSYQKSKCQSSQASNTSQITSDPALPVPGQYMTIVTKVTYNWPDDSCVGCGCVEEPCSHTCMTGTAQGIFAYTQETVTVVYVHSNGLSQTVISGPTTNSPNVTKTSRKAC